MEKSAMMLPKGPPYPPRTAGLGGQPTVHLDVPITAVFLFLFLLGGCGHMTILQLNLRRGHKFPISGAMFGWSMARILACALRIGWAAHPTNISLAITAQLFINLGDLLGFVININLAQRVVRALHPNFGWHLIFKSSLIVVFSLILVSMFILIGFTVDSFFTLDPTKLHNARDAQLYGITYFAFTAVLPIPLVLLSLAVPRKTEAERFGNSSLRTKVVIVISGATALALGAWFRTGTSYLTPRPVTDPAPYSSKACFYIFYFSLEILVIWTYLFARIDLIFYVPDGSKGPGDYSRSAKITKDDVNGEEGRFELNPSPTSATPNNEDDKGEEGRFEVNSAPTSAMPNNEDEKGEDGKIEVDPAPTSAIPNKEDDKSEEGKIEVNPAPTSAMPDKENDKSEEGKIEVAPAPAPTSAMPTNDDDKGKEGRNGPNSDPLTAIVSNAETN